MVPEVSPGTEKKKEEKMRLFVDRKKGVNVKHKEIPAELIVDKVVNTEEFLTARDNYKKTVRFFESKGVKAEVLEQICSLAKNDYTKKVEQLIEMSEDNEKAIIAVAEKYFEVRVMAGKERPPEKVEPIWLD
jgi:NAD-specific glutamate dehydrogenase